MKLPIYQVDAFAESVFTGKPAAVIPRGGWLDVELMQRIAMENNLSETFFCEQGRRAVRAGRLVPHSLVHPRIRDRSLRARYPGLGLPRFYRDPVA